LEIGFYLAGSARLEKLLKALVEEALEHVYDV
jgi:hypothetical protein